MAYSKKQRIFKTENDVSKILGGMSSYLNKVMNSENPKSQERFAKHLLKVANASNYYLELKKAQVIIRDFDNQNFLIVHSLCSFSNLCSRFSFIENLLKGSYVKISRLKEPGTDPVLLVYMSTKSEL